MKGRPEIIIRDDGGVIGWWSVGWGDDKVLMGKAKSAITAGVDLTDVKHQLMSAGFAVLVVPGKRGESK